MRFKGKKPIFSIRDTWDLTYVFNPILAGGLKKFKEVISKEDCVAGCPFGFLPDGYEGLSVEEQERVGDEGVKEWHEAIDTMIYAFGVEEPELPDGVIELKFVDCAEEVDNSLNYETIETVVHDQEALDWWEKEKEEHYKKVKEGRELFKDNYDSLWW